MNQKFFAKLRNALGIVVLLCALMSAGTASAQNYLPTPQALQVVITTLNNQPPTNGGLVGTSASAPVANLDAVGGHVLSDTHIKNGSYIEYLKRLGFLLKQGQATGTAVNNVYDALAQDGLPLVYLDAVKQQVINLLSI